MAARHGTRSRYVQGCKCVACTRANRRYQRAYYRLEYLERELTPRELAEALLERARATASTTRDARGRFA